MALHVFTVQRRRSDWALIETRLRNPLPRRSLSRSQRLTPTVPRETFPHLLFWLSLWTFQLTTVQSVQHTSHSASFSHIQPPTVRPSVVWSKPGETWRSFYWQPSMAAHGCAWPHLYGFVGQRLTIHTGLVEKVAGLSQWEALGWETPNGWTNREQNLSKLPGQMMSNV